MCTEEYLKWVKQANLEPLTGNQYDFAEWLLKPENSKEIIRIGDMETIFKSIRNYLKWKKPSK